MAEIAFTAPEYRRDGSLTSARYAFSGSTADGWEIRREGAPHLRLPSGYRLLRTSHCGICATDLARHHLPFALPQVTGHELVAMDDAGRAYVVEINASHAARGIADGCAYCASGLASHCPDRLVLGIHDLPGGFSPWVLVPVAAATPVPAALDARTATFVEPFAAALHAVEVVTRVPRRRIAVLGTGRLGLLVVAALAAWRRRTHAGYEVLALARRPDRGALARALGADHARDPDACSGALADVVVDTTGAPDGLARALGLASSEVHVKTTCGAPAAGLAHATALVVDEVAIAPATSGLEPPLGGPAYATAVVLGASALPPTLAAAGIRVVDPEAVTRTPLAGADVVVAGSVAAVDDAIRPTPGVERGLVRPRGLVLLDPTDDGPLATAVRERGLVVTTSRCGAFAPALDLLPSVSDLADRLVDATLPVARIGDAFVAAARPGALKVVVAQPNSLV